MCRSVDEIQVSNNSATSLDFNDLFIDSVESTVRNGQLLADFEVGPSNTFIQLKVDTGSQVNVLPYQTLASNRS